MSAVGGGEDGASFVFEKVESPEDTAGSIAGKVATTTMAFTFPPDFEARALSTRRKADFYQKMTSLAAVVVKAIKIFTAFGLIISLAVLIVAGICLLVVAIIAMARGGGGQRGNHHQMLTHKLRFLLLQLRQILWLYAICGGGSQDDPFMREVAGDLAFVLSMCAGNPMHPSFWMRLGRRRSPFGSSSGGRGWGYSFPWRTRNGRDGRNFDNDDDGVAMIRRGSWGNDESRARDDGPLRSNSLSLMISQSDNQQQRGLLSIAVEFLFGPNDSINKRSTISDRPGGLSVEELERWRFRAAIIMALSTASEGKGLSLRELLPYTDNPPVSVNDASALRETMKIIAYFNGKPAIIPLESNSNSSSNAFGGLDARFFFPEIMAEMESGLNDVTQQVLSLNSSKFAPPSDNQNPKHNIVSILYKSNNPVEDGDTSISMGSMPQYIYERPKFLTHLSQNQFGQCLFLGLLNYIGIVSVQSAVMPGGVFDLSINVSSSSRERSSGYFWISFGSVVILKLLKILRFYANLFFLLPLCRLSILMIMNYFIERRNRRRLSFVTE